MNIFSRWILALGILLAFHPSAFEPSACAQIAPADWPVSSAPARFVIDQDQPGPLALVSSVSLYLPEPRWAGMTVRVFTDTGVAVGSDLLWTAPGEPTTFVFDSSSGSKRYLVYMGASSWPPMHLAEPKAGVWLETRVGDGKAINHLPDMLLAWSQSRTVLGKALVPGIFEGGNRFGPEANLFEHLQGWFDAPTAEHLQMALVSTDASFVLVDGKEVVEWPGLHYRGYQQPPGPPRAGVDVAAGLHVVDYYNAYASVALNGKGEMPVTCTLTVKGGPFPDWTSLTPDHPFFRPSASYHATAYDLMVDSSGGAASPGAAPALAIDLVNKEQSMLDTDVPDIGLISLQLTSLVPETNTVTIVNWTFDDGTTAQGQSVKHLFPRPGMRTVHISLSDGQKEVASFSQTINVHPDWAHQAGQPPDLYPEHEADIMARNPATLSVPDLASCFAVFGAFKKSEGLVKMLPAVCAKMKEINEADLPFVKDAALFLAHDDWAHFTEEIQLLRALIDRSASAPATPQSITMGSRCRLGLAQLLLKTSDHTDEVRSLITAINVPALPDDESRALAILRADLALATGDIAGAKKQYETLTGDPSSADARSLFRQTGEIGQTRAFIEAKDFAAAEDLLNAVATEAPSAKMTPDWALTRLRLYQEQNLPGVALLWAKRLLPVITEGGRSELLFRLTDLAFTQGDDDLAHKTLAELLKKHPYSQETAQAKEKWPGK